MQIKANVFYCGYDDTIFVCFERVPWLKDYERTYNIIRDGQIIASGNGAKDDPLIRPWEFDNDHHTELFKPDTRNWLCLKDTTFQRHFTYTYQVETEGGRHKSIPIVVTAT